jgi:hypothetical protein
MEMVFPPEWDNKESMTLLSTLLSQNPLQGTFQGAGAAGLQPNFASPGKPLETFLTVFLGFFTIVGGLMFLLYFVFAALQWLSTGGDKGKVEGAKTQMTNAALGLVVVILSQFIISIVGNVLGLQILNPASAIMGIWR